MKQDHFNILRKVYQNPQVSQRQMSKELNLSLGKLNYCLKELKKKGFLKVKNFRQNPKKLNYLYVLTPQGITEKTKITIDFMKRKMQEYDELKKELENHK